MPNKIVFDVIDFFFFFVVLGDLQFLIEISKKERRQQSRLCPVLKVEKYPSSYTRNQYQIFHINKYSLSFENNRKKKLKHFKTLYLS